MDPSELDEWLGTTEADRPADATPPWRDGPTASAPATSSPRGGAPWVRIAAAGGVVWLLVMLVLVGRGEQRGDASTGALADIEQLGAADQAPAASTAGTGDPGDADPQGANGASSGLPDDGFAVGAATGDGTGAGTGDGTATDAGGTDGDPAVEAEGAPSGTAIGTSTAAAAVLALREALAAADAEHYLEWATPLSRSPLGPEADLLLIDAVWLTGEDGTWLRSSRGYWAIVMAPDDTPRSRPWLVGAADPPTLPEPRPPMVRQRAEEAQAALEGAGWQEIVVHGSEPHPDLAAVWIVVADGVDPSGTPRRGAEVWLTDVGVLQVLGVEALGGSA